MSVSHDEARPLSCEATGFDSLCGRRPEVELARRARAREGGNPNVDVAEDEPRDHAAVGAGAPAR